MNKSEADIEKKTKSILSLGIEELEQILGSNELPTDCDLSGLEERKDFKTFFAHRLAPRFIAKTLLEEKMKARLIEPTELKEERLKIKKMELELKKDKAGKTTWQYQQIWNAISNVNKKLDVILNYLSSDVNSNNKGGE